MLVAILFSFLINSFIPEDSILAVVNNNKIYSSQFLIRYNNYLQQVGVKDNLLIRRQILENMINENLILSDAKNQKWYNSHKFRVDVNSKLEALYISYFYKAAIETVAVSDDELRNTFLNMNTKIRARHIYAESMEQATVLQSRLISGESFFKIANEVFTDKKLKLSGGDLGYFSVGEMESSIEAEAFNLKIGEMSEPIKTEDGYSIIKVDDKIVNPLITESDFVKNKNKVFNYAKKQKQIDLTKELSSKIAEELQITYNLKVLQILFNEWKNIIATDSYKIEKQTSLQKIKSENLVEYFNGKLSLLEFYSLLQKTTIRQQNRVKNIEDLKTFISGILTREEIITRSKKNKYNELAEFIINAEADTNLFILNKWRDNVVSNNYNIDPISFASKNKKEEYLFDEKVKKYYIGNKQNYIHKEEVNVAEIFVSDLNYAFQLFDSLKQGQNFYKLAKKYSQRNFAELQNWEFGFGSRESYGIYADTLFSLKLNEQIGPVPLSNGYSIFKVVGIKKSKQKSFLEVKNEVAKEVYREESNIIFLNMLVQLRKKSKLEINYSLVEKLNLQ